MTIEGIRNNTHAEISLFSGTKKFRPLAKGKDSDLRVNGLKGKCL